LVACDVVTPELKVNQIYRSHANFGKLSTSVDNPMNENEPLKQSVLIFEICGQTDHTWDVLEKNGEHFEEE
jgi:hypothetical protein